MAFLSGTPTPRILLRVSTLLVFLGLFPVLPSAQTFVGNQTLTTQAEVAAFTDGGTPYTHIAGNLTLTATGTITDLTSLASLTNITGTLSISNWGTDDTAGAGNPLGAFAALQSVGNLIVGTGEVGAVPGLQSLANTGLETISGMLYVRQAPNLATASFPALTTTGGDLHLTDLPQLDYFDGPLLATIGGQLRLNELDDLVNLDHLPAVASIGTRLIIRGNDNLTTLDGLSASVSGGAHFSLSELAVEYNQALTSVAGISADISEALSLKSNNSLNNVGRDITLTSGMRSIEITNNTILFNISRIFDGTNVIAVDTVNVSDNNALRLTGGQELNVGSTLVYANNPMVSLLLNFEGTSALSGMLEISNNSSLTETNSLRNLISVEGGVTLQNNDGWTNTSAIINTQPASALTGFNSLERAAFLVFDGNDGMANLDDFSALTILDNALEITNNGALGDCCQLPCQVSVNGAAFDTYNDAVVVSNNTGSCADKPAIRGNCAGVGCAAIAPVTWTDFRVEEQGSGARLYWRTASESQNAYFRVERSTNGSEFLPIGRVTGAGTSTVEQDYHFVDSVCPAGRNYYRLRQVDVDGSASLSAVRSVWIGAAQPADLIVSPNPVTAGGVVRGMIAGDWDAGLLTVEVFSVSGRRVAHFSRRSAESWELATATWPPGVYHLRVSDGSRVAVRRFAVH